MTSVACSMAGRPVPSKMRAPVNAVVPPCAWTDEGATAYDHATQMHTRALATRVIALSARVDMSVMLNSSIRFRADDFRKRRPWHRLPVNRHDLRDVELQPLHQVVQSRIGGRGSRRRWFVGIKEVGFDEHFFFRQVR